MSTANIVAALRIIRESFLKPVNLPTSDEEWDDICGTLAEAADALEAYERTTAHYDLHAEAHFTVREVIDALVAAGFGRTRPAALPQTEAKVKE